MVTPCFRVKLGNATRDQLDMGGVSFNDAMIQNDDTQVKALENDHDTIRYVRKYPNDIKIIEKDKYGAL